MFLQEKTRTKLLPKRYHYSLPIATLTVRVKSLDNPFLFPLLEQLEWE